MGCKKKPMTSPENLRKFLESDDPAMVMMGLSMAKGAEIEVKAEDIENILIGNDGVNLSQGLEFAKEANIEEDAIELVISTIDSVKQVGYHDSLMREIMTSNNEKAIDALVEYGDSDYDGRYIKRLIVLQFFSEIGTSQLNIKQKKLIKTLAEITLDGNECYNSEEAYEAECALAVLETVGDFDSLSSFGDVQDGACFNTNKYECDAAETNAFTIQDKLATATAKILSEEKDNTKVIDYLTGFLEEELINPKSNYDEVQETVEAEYPYFISILNLKTNILKGLKTEDKSIISTINTINKAIKEAESRHPEPEDFDYVGYAGY